MIKLIKVIAPFVDRTIYVWGGQGENVCVQTVKNSDGTIRLDPEAWIRGKETSSSNATRAIELYRRRIADGINPVICFDCSGFVCKVLEALGIIKPGADYNTKGLYALCNTHPSRAALKLGDLCFYSKTGKAADISHVGIYFGDGNVCECRGRAYGVCVTDFDDNPSNWTTSWNMFGRLDKMAPFVVDEPAEPLPLDVVKPVHAGAGYGAMQAALNACGYTDADGMALVVDDKWGGKSRAAWDKAVAANIGPMTGDVTLRIPGVGKYKYGLKEE